MKVIITILLVTMAQLMGGLTPIAQASPRALYGVSSNSSALYGVRRSGKPLSGVRRPNFRNFGVSRSKGRQLYGVRSTNREVFGAGRNPFSRARLSGSSSRRNVVGPVDVPGSRQGSAAFANGPASLQEHPQGSALFSNF